MIKVLPKKFSELNNNYQCEAYCWLGRSGWRYPDNVMSLKVGGTLCTNSKCPNRWWTAIDLRELDNIEIVDCWRIFSNVGLKSHEGRLKNRGNGIDHKEHEGWVHNTQGVTGYITVF